MGFNAALFNIINGWAGHIGWLDELMKFSATYLWLLMTFVVGAFLLIDHRRWRNMVLVAIGSAAFARLVIVTIIKWLYVYPRPELVMPIRALIPGDNQSSFPSGHATFVFALAMGVYLYNKKLGWCFFILAALVSLARVFVGVHWPYDIIAGAGLGILVTWLCDKLYRKHKHHFGL